MPSITVQANTTVQPVATEIRNKKHKVKSLTIDNTGGAAARTIRVRDSFTPDVTDGVAVPIATTVDRFRWTTILAGVDNLGEKDLGGLTIIGALGIIADAIDAGCYITVGYESE